MTVLVKKVFISSKPSIVCLLCPPPCGHFSIQESAVGGLSYKVKKLLLETTLAFLAWFQQELFFTYLYFPLFFCAIPLRSADR